MRVIGLDVCKNSVVACTLDGARPSDPQAFYHDYSFERHYADARGVRALLANSPDVAVMEPTGVNYMKLWATQLAKHGVAIALVGHKQLRSYRENLGLPDKDDAADALALACYYLEHCNSPRRFVRLRDPVIAQIRDLVLRLHHLKRLQSPIINRLRQDLAWQFPEVAHCSLGATLFWDWLALRRTSSKYDCLYARTIGTGLIDETRSSAKALLEIKVRSHTLENSIAAYMKDPRFSAYRKVMKSFGFGSTVEALILSQIYPLENYLGRDGLPEVIIRKGRNSGKPTRRHLSRRRFQKALGVAPMRLDSGDQKSHTKAGSELCRMALWQWLFTRIEPRKSRIHTPIGERLGAILDFEKMHKPVKLARSRVCSKAALLLFNELVKELKA